MMMNRLARRLAVPAVLPALGLSTAMAGTLELSFTHRDSREPLADVVVIVASDRSAAPVQAEMSQKDRTFSPHVLLVPRGSSVNFPNYDNTQHHVYSFSSAKPFNIELYAGVPEQPIRFDKAGIVELGCNIHDTMQAYILVTDTPHVMRSGAAGIARLEVPDGLLGADGSLAVRVWHPRLVDNSQARDISLTGPFPIRQHLDLELLPESAPAGGLGDLQERFRNL